MAAELPMFWAWGHLPTGATGMAWSGGDNAIAAYGGDVNPEVVDYSGRRCAAMQLYDSRFDVTIPTTTDYAVGMWYQADSSNATRVLVFRDGATAICTLALASGVLSAYKGTTAGTLLGTGATTIPGTAWVFIELSVVFNDGAGAVVVRVNGVEEFAVGSLALPGTPDNLRFDKSGTFTAGHFARFAEFYIRDAATFFGPIEMELLNPTSDVSVAWTPDSGANNYGRVQAPAAAASYCDADAVDLVDEYGLADLAGAGAILAVTRVTVSDNPAGGAPALLHGIKRGASSVYGNSRATGVGSPKSQSSTFVTQPDSSAWTATAVDELSLLRKSA